MSQDEPHILVTGDAWQYVPFGRSRLKALRATGLSYASQTFIVNGATIKVRIAGTQSFINADGGSSLYMESGQPGWDSWGTGDIRLGDAGKWYFLDIPTADKYLGAISSSGKQANNPALAEAQRSLAIGWPAAKTGTDAEKLAADEKTRADYTIFTQMKKKLVAAFPPAIFSGKMRLFMQALYGARETLKPVLEGDDPIAPVVMSFVGQDDQSGRVLNVASDAMGVFSAPDGTYWLLTILTGAKKVMFNRIITSGSGSLVASLKNLNAVDRVKAEAYVFAHSYVEISVPGQEVYATGTFDMPLGFSLAYGWKWNTAGTKASIVAHEDIGTSVANYRWYSRTVHLTFGYTAKTDTTPAAFTVSSQVIAHGEWIDGWGDYNIFVPLSPTTRAPLALKSRRVGSGTLPALFSFTDIPVYGWYIDDVWTSATITADETARAPTTTNFSSVPPLMDGITAWNTLDDTKTFNSGRTFKFGGYSYEGASFNHTKHYEVGQAGAITPDVTGIGVNPYRGWSDGSTADVILTNYPYGCRTSPTTLIVNWVVTDQTSLQLNKWSLVIPGCDAEAMYIPTYDTDKPLTQTTRTLNGDMGYVAFTAYTFRDDGFGYPIWDVPIGNFAGHMEPIPQMWFYYTHTDVTTTTVDAATLTVGVECFNKREHITGVPGGSYYGIFNCSYAYQFYDRGMYTNTSYNGRYVMSEAPPKPSSAKEISFIGWA